jgi:sugar/nucleoside kinase (ribokinase family)
LQNANAVIVSAEDVAHNEEQIEHFAINSRLLAVTESFEGSRLYWNHDLRRFRPPQVNEADATGAGDVFAAAFFIRLHETRDPWEAARFANQIAAISVTRIGLAGIPTKDEIQKCLVEVIG